MNKKNQSEEAVSPVSAFSITDNELYMLLVKKYGHNFAEWFVQERLRANQQMGLPWM